MTEATVMPMQLTPLQHLRALLLSRAFVRACWCANVLALLATAIWILRDSKFPDAVTAFGRHIAEVGGDKSPLAVVPPLLWPRVDALWCVLIVAALSTIGIAVGLIAGSGRHRNVRSWLVVMLLLAGWLTLFTTWPELVWRGQVWRVRGSLDEFANTADELLAAWPDNDGDIQGLGPYMAYPIGKPRTLMFMTTPPVPGTSLGIKVIERGENDSMHFQLAGNEEGVWLVREQGDEPSAFFSGLDGEYIPVQFRQVSPGWFIVRYIYAPTVLGDPGVSTEQRR
jgi:hypothetical protein